MTTENFATLLEQSLQDLHLRPGAVLEGTVVEMTSDYVIVNAGLKAESPIARNEFLNMEGECEVSVGDTTNVVLVQYDDEDGDTVLSRELAKRAEVWDELGRAQTANATIYGMVTGKVKGGFTVEIQGLRAFLPGSLVDVRPQRDIVGLEGKSIELKVIKLDKKRNNIVVSRRAVMEAESSAEREATLEGIHEGKVVKGVVKNLTDYGAFVDLGGIDGLLHKTDMAWSRINHPSEVLNVSDEINVMVLKLDRERGRVSLGLKQLDEDPWVGLATEYPKGATLRGEVTNVTDYGCFVEIRRGVEGLVHQSEMDWTNKNVPPNKIVQLGDEIEVMVLEIDEERRRISLGIKQCQSNPWQAFTEVHKKGEKITGKIKSITDFGVFIGLEGNIDGLVHLSDISWDEGDDVIRDFKKNQEIEAVILAMDPERERISLGIKQLDSDPFTAFIDAHGKGTIVDGKVIEVDAKVATIELAEEVTGTLRATEISRERIEDVRTALKEGDDVKVKILTIDKKNRTLSLSIKAQEEHTEAELTREYAKKSSDAAPNTTLGDLLKGKMDTDNEDDTDA